MEAIKQLARERMKGKCRVCPVCDGRVCSGEVPGMGGAGTGSSFRANVEALSKVKLAMRCLHEAAMPDTSTEVLGLKLAMPVMAAPIGGVAFNMGKNLSIAQPSGVGFHTGFQNGVPNPERGCGKTRIFHLFNANAQTRTMVTELTVWDWVGDLRRLRITDAQGNDLRFQLVDGETQWFWDHRFRGSEQAHDPEASWHQVCRSHQIC